MTPLSTTARCGPDFRSRDCSPTLGGFLKPPPFAFDAGDINLYRYVGNSPVVATDPTGEVSQKEFEELRKNQRIKTKTERIDTPLAAAELQELLDLTEKSVANQRMTTEEALRSEELLWQLENAGIQPGATELEKLKAIMEKTKAVLDKLPEECWQAKVLKVWLGYYARGIEAAIKGIAKIEQNLYERYAEHRRAGGSHEDFLEGNEEWREKFRIRDELEQIQAQLNPKK